MVCMAAKAMTSCLERKNRICRFSFNRVKPVPEQISKEIYGYAGCDLLMGGAGADMIWGGAGDDFIEGDMVITDYSYLWSMARFVDTQGSVTPFGYTIINVDFVYPDPAEQGDDSIYGGAGKDLIYGNGGNDFIDGGKDDDAIAGDSGNDILLGQDGDDILIGGGQDLWVQGAKICFGELHP